MKIILKNDEYEFMIANNFVTPEIKKILRQCSRINDYLYDLVIDEDNADEVREKLLEQFQMEVIGINDEINKNGMIIENLIDKFYTC